MIQPAYNLRQVEKGWREMALYARVDGIIDTRT
jgi:hypothetical protein